MNTANSYNYHSDYSIARFRCRTLIEWSMIEMTQGELDAALKPLKKLAQSSRSNANFKGVWRKRDDCLDFILSLAVPKSDSIAPTPWLSKVYSRFTAGSPAEALFADGVAEGLLKDDPEALDTLIKRAAPLTVDKRTMAQILLYAASNMTLIHAINFLRPAALRFDDDHVETVSFADIATDLESLKAFMRRAAAKEAGENDDGNRVSDEAASEDTQTVSAEAAAGSTAQAESVAVDAVQEVSADTPAETSEEKTDAVCAASPFVVVAEPTATSRLFVRSRTLSVTPVREGTTRYLGYIRANKVGPSVFYNFYPEGEWLTDRFVEIQNVQQRFPRWGAINFFAKSGPKDGAWYVADIDSADIRPNIDTHTNQVRDDYQKQASFETLLRNGRVFSASNCGIFLTVKPVKKSFSFTETIYVKVADFPAGNKRINFVSDSVLLDCNGVLYGPVRLKATSNGDTYVDFRGQLNCGVIPGFIPDTRYMRTVHQYVGNGTGHDIFAMLRYVDARFLQAVDCDVWTDSELFAYAARTVGPDESPDSAVLADDEDIFEARRQRLQAYIRRAKLTAEDRDTLAEFAVKHVFTSDTDALRALAPQVARDENLLSVLANESAVGAKLAERQAAADKLESRIAEREADAAKIDDELKTRRSDLQALENTIADRQSAVAFLDLSQSKIELEKALNERIAAQQAESAKLTRLRDDILDKISEAEEKAGAISSDLLPQSLTQSVSVWRNETEADRCRRAAAAMSSLPYTGPQGTELAAELVSSFRRVRPYDTNTILNLYINFVQNFLTVFAGEPGSGKTSVCTILADSLGLSDFGRRTADIGTPIPFERFITVPVEYGWTSKHDFIGFRNPLTNRFESPDPARWQLIRTLDAEARSETGSVYPAMMLLDEANLSPLEYYWSDWMRLCDEHPYPGSVTLWDKGPLFVPETLRFTATINSDGTTTPLSPRLIDRASVISLPEPTGDGLSRVTQRAESTPATWAALKRVFGVRPGTPASSPALTYLTTELYSAFEAAGLRASPRTRRQMVDYIVTASDIFTSDGKPAQLDALDFAVLQKLLPKINGTGEAYREGLEALLELLRARSLDRSAVRLARILNDGRAAMDCYRFF